MPITRAFWSIAFAVLVASSCGGRKDPPTEGSGSSNGRTSPPTGALGAVASSADIVLDELGKLESTKDVTCWTSFRQLDWFIAERSYSESGTLMKITAMKGLVRAVWEKASQGGAAQVAAADIERAVKLPKIALPGKVQSGLQTFANDIGLKNFTDYQKTAEHDRVVLAVIMEELYHSGGGVRLKPLDATGVRALADAATTLSLIMLKESSKAAEVASSQTIDAPHVQTAYKKVSDDLAIKNTPFDAQPLTPEQVATVLQPLTKKLIDRKVESLHKFNKGTTTLDDINKVTRIPLTAEALTAMTRDAQSFVHFVAAGYEPMQADNYLSDGSFAKTALPRRAYVDAQWAQNVVMQLFRHTMNPNGDIVIRFEPNPGPVTEAAFKPFEVKLLGHEMDGVRDSAIHWTVLQTVWQERPFAMDPFGAEYVSEVVSMMMTLWIRRGEVYARELGKQTIDEAVVGRIRKARAAYAQVQVQETSAAWTPARQAQKAKVIAALKQPLFRDVSAIAGLPTKFPQWNADLANVLGHTEPDKDLKKVEGHTEPPTKNLPGHVDPPKDTKNLPGHVDPPKKDTKNLPGHVDPPKDTKNLPGHVDPPKDTKNLPGHVDPPKDTPKDTKNLPGHVDPPKDTPKDTKNLPGHVDPPKDTKNLPGHVDPPKDTKNLPGHVAPDVTSIQGHFNLQVIMGGGIAVGDVNNDDYPDLYLAGEALGRLYLNRGKAAPGKFVDATAQYGLPTDLADGHGVLLFDFDGDGDMDLLVLRSEHPTALFRNDNGKYTDVAKQLGITTTRGAHVAHVFDFDRDGDLDIYIGYYGAREANATNGAERSVPSLDGRNGSPNQLWRNDGDKFVEIGHQAKVDDVGWTLAVTSFDRDNDGDLDLFLANDFGPDTFYENNGDGTFKDISVQTHTDDRGSGMNAEVGDLNGDGKWDIYVTNIDMFSKNIKVIFPRDESTIRIDDNLTRAFQYLSGNKLYVATDDGNYRSEEQLRFEPKDRGWGWDASFFDYDNDGDDDLYITNGWVNGSYAGNQKNQFYLNDDGFLFLAPEQGDEAFPGNTRSCAAIDIDLDGDIDLVVNNFRQPPRVLVNQQRSANRYVQVRLAGKGKNLLALGATVTIATGGKTILRQMSGGRGYLSQGDIALTAGVGTADTVDITVRWPDGTITTHPRMATNKRHTIKQP